MKLTIDLAHRDEIEFAMGILIGILNPPADKPKETTSVKVTTSKERAEKKKPPPNLRGCPAGQDLPSVEEATPPTQPPLSRQDLGQHLRGIALKYGDAAQTAIGKIVLAKSGTQALSQVDEALLPVIKEAIDAWVDAQS